MRAHALDPNGVLWILLDPSVKVGVIVGQGRTPVVLEGVKLLCLGVELQELDAPLLRGEVVFGRSPLGNDDLLALQLADLGDLLVLW